MRYGRPMRVSRPPVSHPRQGFSPSIDDRLFPAGDAPAFTGLRSRAGDGASTSGRRVSVRRTSLSRKFIAADRGPMVTAGRLAPKCRPVSPSHRSACRGHPAGSWRPRSVAPAIPGPRDPWHRGRPKSTASRPSNKPGGRQTSYAFFALRRMEPQNKIPPARRRGRNPDTERKGFRKPTGPHPRPFGPACRGPAHRRPLARTPIERKRPQANARGQERSRIGTSRLESRSQ